MMSAGFRRGLGRGSGGVAQIVQEQTDELWEG